MGDADQLRTMLAAETEYLEELIRRGILPAGARREPTSRELRAGVRAITRLRDPWRCLSGHHHVVPSLARECDARLEQATKPRAA